MALPVDGRSINNIIASTLDAQLGEFVDSFFNTNALVMRLLQRYRDGARTVRFRGGAEIKTGIIYTGVNAKSYGRGATFDTDQAEFMTDMQFQWKRAYAPINVDHLDFRRNAGDEVQIVDYVESLAEVASMSLRDNLGFQIYGTLPDTSGVAQTNAAIPSTDFDGLYNGVAATGSYGGITRGGNRGTPGFAIEAVVQAVTTPWSKPLMQSVYGKVTFDRAKPDLILTTQNVWNQVWERTEPQDRNYEGGPLRQVGFDTIRFNGAEIVADSHVEPGRMYLLNTEYIQLWLMEGVDFIRRGSSYGPLGFPIPNQDAFVDQLIVYGDLIVTGPRFQATITGIVES